MPKSTIHRLNQRRQAMQAMSRQKGYIQGLVIVIVVIMILTIGILYVGMGKMTQSKVANEVQYDTDLSTRVKAYSAQVGLFTSTNANQAALVGRGFFPQAQVSGTTITNQWNGTVTTAIGTINTAGDAIDVTSPNVPVADCKQLGTSLDQVVSKLTINGTVVKPIGSPTDPAKVDAACTGTNNVFIKQFSAS